MIFNQGTGGGGASLSPIIVVSAPTGSTVTCKNGSTVLTAEESSGTWSFAIPAYGIWTVVGVSGEKTETRTVEVTAIEVYFVTLGFFPSVLNNATWAQVKQASDSGIASNYWSVGDTKQITLNGKVSDGLTLSNYQTWVYIIGFDHNSAVEGTGIAFGGFKTAASGGTDVALCDSGYNSGKYSGRWFNMNNSATNSGGWSSSRMRSTTLPLVKSALPPDLQAVLKTTTIYSDNTGGGSNTASYVTATQDELYLLAEFEIFGEYTYANSYERDYQQQYSYYASGNSKIKYRHDSTSNTVVWWERSVGRSNSSTFCTVNVEGPATSSNAAYSVGLAPAFKVGSNPPPSP